MKKILSILFCLLLLAGSTKDEVKLPLPEVSEGMRGELGIDKNVNQETLDQYLN